MRDKTGEGKHHNKGLRFCIQMTNRYHRSSVIVLVLSVAVGIVLKHSLEATRRVEQAAGASIKGSTDDWPPRFSFRVGSEVCAHGCPEAHEETPFIPRFLKRLGWHQVNESDDPDLMYVRRFNTLSDDQHRRVCELGTMMYNHIPGDEHLCHKDLIVQHMHDHGAIGNGHDQVLVPATYLMSNMTDVARLCHRIEDGGHESDEIYFVKVPRGVHNSFGVRALNTSETYQTFCHGPMSEGLKRFIVQEGVRPLLLQGKKFDIRVNTYVLSSRPLVIVGIQNRTCVRVSSTRHDDQTVPLQYREVTNMIVQNYLSRLLAEKGLASAGESTCWTMEDIGDALDAKTSVKDRLRGMSGRRWVDEVLWPRIWEATNAIFVRSALPHMESECLGSFSGNSFDFMLDEHLNVWFLEVSSSGHQPGLYDWIGAAETYLRHPSARLDIFPFQEERRRLMASKGPEQWQEAYKQWDILAKLHIDESIGTIIADQR